MKDWRKGKYICLSRVYKTDNFGENKFYIYKLSLYIMISSKCEKKCSFLLYLQVRMLQELKHSKERGKRKITYWEFLKHFYEKGQ